jgi:hypothetical protein
MIMKREYIIPAIQVKKIGVLAMTTASLEIGSGSGNPKNSDAKELFEFLLDDME